MWTACVPDPRLEPRLPDIYCMLFKYTVHESRRSYTPVLFCLNPWPWSLTPELSCQSVGSLASLVTGHWSHSALQVLYRINMLIECALIITSSDSQLFLPLHQWGLGWPGWNFSIEARNVTGKQFVVSVQVTIKWVHARPQVKWTSTANTRNRDALWVTSLHYCLSNMTLLGIMMSLKTLLPVKYVKYWVTFNRNLYI